MSTESDRKAREFLAIADQFKLGVLVTESSHPVTANLSDVARGSIEEALGLLFTVDDDVLRRFRLWVQEEATRPVATEVLHALRQGGRVCFTGCGSTGRLSILLESIWRRFWQETARAGKVSDAAAREREDRVVSAMAGGDFALIRAVEGFEDFTQFGRRQIGDLEIGAGDVLFAITEGGETSWVIGTAWEALDRGARVFFVYNNPDDILCAHVQRSREVIQEPRITKVNLTTGPMAISGSTRMQATTIQLIVLLTVLEWVVRQELHDLGVRHVPSPEEAPRDFLAGLESLFLTLHSQEFRASLAALVRFEEATYRAGHKNTYFADHLAVDMLTDTTERSPTFCTPPFRRYDDTKAAESWAFLCVPCATTDSAWQELLRRHPRCVAWSEEVIQQLIPPEKVERTAEIVQRIGVADLLKFRIGLDGLPYRHLGPGDIAVSLVAPEDAALLAPRSPVTSYLETLRKDGVRTAWVRLYHGAPAPMEGGWDVTVSVPVPATNLLLDGVTRAGVKMVLNALSTCTMVRLGRVMGNTMIWVVASNLKLMDRATRYIARLTGLGYEAACHLLFEAIEYVAPRMAADQVYPPVVGLSVMRVRHNVPFEEAERLLWEEIGTHRH